MDVEQRIHPKAGEDGLRELAREVAEAIQGTEWTRYAADTILDALTSVGERVAAAAAQQERERLRKPHENIASGTVECVNWIDQAYQQKGAYDETMRLVVAHSDRCFAMGQAYAMAKNVEEFERRDALLKDARTAIAEALDDLGDTADKCRNCDAITGTCFEHRTLARLDAWLEQKP